MVKCGEDSDAYTFSCEGNVKKYNVAYFNYDDKKTKSFAFNRCVSGWQKSSDGFTPYTQGAETDDSPHYEQITLDCNGYDKKIYVLDGQSEVNFQNPDPTSACISPSRLEA